MSEQAVPLLELAASPSILAAIAVASVAGVIRGITGFGGAMIMAPPLALLLGPKLAVPITLMLETCAAAPMLPAAARIARWRVLMPVSVVALLFVPLGSYMLLNADPQTLRRAIALTVIVFAVLLLRGARYTGPQRTPVLLGLGGLSGAMLGATSIGAPPVILYLLSGPDPIEVTRANLTLYVVVISAAGLAALAWQRVIDAQALTIALLMTPTYALGVIAGSRLFSRFSDQRFRQLTLSMMLVVSVGVLFA